MAYLDPPDDPEGCDVCGKYVNDCICPECPVCGEVGRPACYEEHGMTRSPAQVESWDSMVAQAASDAELEAQADQEIADYYRQEDESVHHWDAPTDFNE